VDDRGLGDGDAHVDPRRVARTPPRFGGRAGVGAGRGRRGPHASSRCTGRKVCVHP